ncbi:MAG TPA: hypothetical protein VF771_05445 [Longimicrobiaceae bacterium]
MQPATIYREVFVVHGPTLRDLAPAWVSAAVGIALALSLLAYRRFDLEMKRGQLWASRTGAVVLPVIALLSGMIIVGDTNAAKSRYRRGDYSVAEGTVSGFIPGSERDHREEEFSVGGQQFRYSSTALSPYFHRTAEKGGPIRPGLRVRISHVNGDILRLEVVS